MSKQIWVAIIAIVIIVAGMWYFQKAPVNNGEVMVVGAILPLTGKEANTGETLKNGLELAVKDKNIKVIYEDSQSDTKTAISAYQKLTKTDGVKVVFTSISGVTLGLAPLAEQDKVLLLVTGSAARSISQAGDFVFRHNLLPNDEAKALADFIYNKKGLKNIAVLTAKAEAGISYREGFLKDYEALGGKVVLSETYEKGSTNFRTQLTKIKAVKPEAVVALSYAAEAGFILKQSKEMLIEVPWFSIYAVEDKESVAVGGEAMNGLIYTHFFDPNSELPAFKDFKNKYQRQFGDTPNSYSVLAYDMMNILSEMAGLCGGVQDSVCIKDRLYKVKDYEGASGLIGFDVNGDTNKTIIFKTVKNGQFVKLEE